MGIIHKRDLDALRGFGCAALAILLLSAHAAIAQPGSVGGTVGKRSKSVSGSDEAGPASPSRPQSGSDKSRRQEERAPKQDFGRSISGSWTWEASCASGGTWQGGLTLSATPSGSLSGAFGGGHMGSIVGTVSGSRVAFYRAMYKQRWTGTLSGSGGAGLRMSGPVSDPARSGCRFSATRN